MTALRLGPVMSTWGRQAKDGDCDECGGQCAPECGLHPAGCVFGGLSDPYWLIADECELDHGERPPTD